jgi:hypothetical protein
MGKIIGGLLMAGVGFLTVWKADWIVNNFGYSNWAESKLGSSGGTRLMYKFIGLIVLFFGMLMVTGLNDEFLRATIGKMFNR